LENYINARLATTETFERQSQADRAAIREDVSRVRTELAVVSNSTATARAEAADAKSGNRGNIALVVSAISVIATIVLAFVHH